MQLKAKKDSDGYVEVTATLLRRGSFHARRIEAAREETHFLDPHGATCTYMHFIRDKEGKIVDSFQCQNGTAAVHGDKHGWLCHQHKPKVRNRPIPFDAWDTYGVDVNFIVAQDLKLIYAGR